MTEEVVGPEVHFDVLYMSDRDRLALLLLEERVVSTLGALGILERKAVELGWIMKDARAREKVAEESLRTEATVMRANFDRQQAVLAEFKVRLKDKYGFEFDQSVTFDDETGRLKTNGDDVSAIKSV